MERERTSHRFNSLKGMMSLAGAGAGDVGEGGSSTQQSLNWEAFTF